jgi:hypothetical protein
MDLNLLKDILKDIPENQDIPCKVEHEGQELNKFLAGVSVDAEGNLIFFVRDKARR